MARDHYTKSGESTNFCRSYTGVAFRNLYEIPRSTSGMKKEILGRSAVGDFEKTRVQKEVNEKGPRSAGENGSPCITTLR